MDFINWKKEDPKIEVELKYCERCGGLGLRPLGDSGVYCRSCRAHIASLPRASEERSSRLRLPRPKPEDLRGQIEYLQAVTELEVRA